MQIIRHAEGVQTFSKKAREKGLTVGFVPTMGALHEGHLSLVRKSIGENDITVVSIFVNPKQFNNTSDLENYPRTIDADIDLLRSVHCQAVFIPEYDEVYPHEMPDPIDLGQLGEVLEGSFRPGHFNGVTTVVRRLFELVLPHRAYFGQKDYQQLAVIRHMVSTIGMDVDVVSCPTSRTPEGLAMSSRNLLLNEEEKREALILSRCLNMAKEEINRKSIKEVKDMVAREFNSGSACQLEYFEIADANTLFPVQRVEEHQNVVALIAGYSGRVRLIDNLILIP